MEDKKRKTDSKKKIKAEELTDEQVNDVAGGVQAGLITEGGSGEFGPKKKEKPDPSPRKTWL